MRSKDNVSQRPLFSDWPAWHALPADIQQQLKECLANMILEAMDSSQVEEPQEHHDDLPTD